MSMTASNGIAAAATHFFIAWRSMCRTSWRTCRRFSRLSMAAWSGARAGAAAPPPRADLALHSRGDAVASEEVSVVGGRGKLLREQHAGPADLAHFEGRVRRLLGQPRV